MSVKTSYEKLYDVEVNGVKLTAGELEHIASYYNACIHAERIIDDGDIADIETAINLGDEIESKINKEVWEDTNIPDTVRRIVLDEYFDAFDDSESSKEDEV